VTQRWKIPLAFIGPDESLQAVFENGSIEVHQEAQAVSGGFRVLKDIQIRPPKSNPPARVNRFWRFRIFASPRLCGLLFLILPLESK